MKSLANKSLTFAKTVGCGWRETRGSDCKAYQRLFLCRQAFGAYNTATSYWILNKKGCFSDGVALSRNLLERIANSICGAKSPTQAVELIAYELSEKIRHAKLWNPSPGISAELTRSINEHEKVLPVFLALIQKTKAPDWKFYKRFEEAGVLGLYRSGYFNFSMYTHAGYEVPRPGKYNNRSNPADFTALAAPVITAANYHALNCRDCSRGKCAVHDQSMALLKEFSSRTIGKKSFGTGTNPPKT